MRRIIQWLSTFLLVLLGFSAHAQSSTLTEIIREILPVYFLSWSSDSREFFFTSGMEVPEVYYRVDLPEGDVEQIFESPWQDTLHVRDLYAIRSLSSSALTYHSLRESPDHEWVAMALSSILPLAGESADDPTLQNMYGDPLPYLTLLHRSSGKVLQTALPIRIFPPVIQNFIVNWSEDSNTFVVSDTPGTWVTPTIFHYVTGFAEENGGTMTIEDISTVATIDNVYNIYRIYDVSIDGEYVLLLGNHYDPTSYTDTRHVLLWNAITQRATILERIDAFGVLTAAFAPDSNAELYFLTETGLIEYDTITHQTSVVREDINTQRFFSLYSQFSPDGRYLALIEYQPPPPQHAVSNIYYIAYPFADN